MEHLHPKLKWNDVTVDAYLCFRVRSGPPKVPGTSEISNFLVQFVGKNHSHWHALFSFISGVSKHQTLNISIGTVLK